MIAEIIVIMIKVCSQPQGWHTENAKVTYLIHTRTREQASIQHSLCIF